jgi:hypothetical protein
MDCGHKGKEGVPDNNEFAGDSKVPKRMLRNLQMLMKIAASPTSVVGQKAT